MKNQQEQSSIAVFKGETIRKTMYQKEWWFSVVDVCKVLTSSPDAGAYWRKLKQRLIEQGSEVVTFCHELKLPAVDGKKYETDCANMEGMFRIIQSIPSKKAEPFKRWLARVGKERIDEIQDPELAMERMRSLYEKKGYPKDWIDKRVRGIAVRKDLTDEWKGRGAQPGKDYEILTAEISKATFGLAPSDYKKHKGLKRENLRDHMDDFELILTMLGERTTTEIHRTKDSKGVPRLKDDARSGGQIAGSARKQIERKIGRTVVSKGNFLRNKNRKRIS